MTCCPIRICVLSVFALWFLRVYSALEGRIVNKRRIVRHLAASAARGRCVQISKMHFLNALLIFRADKRTEHDVSYVFAGAEELT